MLPIQFEQKMKQLLNDEFDDYIKSFNKPIFQGLRVNTSKISLEEWNKINPFNTKPVPWCREGFYYCNEKVTKHPYYFAGLYYIQEPSAMSPAAYLPIEKDDYVLDLCAAPGGKSTQVGAKLGCDGILVSNDISASRAKALVKNLDNFGINQAMVISESPEKLASVWEGFFDKILIDAPCSGEGMFKKDNKAIKNWGSQDFSGLQQEILINAGKLLKPGGYMMYSTCTFSADENEHIIRNFLNDNANFESVSMTAVGGIRSGENNSLRLWPHLLDGEGHFLCLMYKKNGNNLTSQYVGANRCISDYKLVAEFIHANTYIPLSEPVMEIDGRVYLVSKNMPCANKIRVLRSGLLLGEIKKNRFEPSHALSIAYAKELYKNTIDFMLSDANIVKYLKGETLLVDKPKGYYVICVDGYPLGWAKSQNHMLKNQYPASWRIS